MKAIVFMLSSILLLGFVGCSASTQTGTLVATTPHQTSTPTEEEMPDDIVENGADLLNSEAVGWIKLYIKASEIIERLGQPETKTEPEIWEADDMEHSTWSYKSKGLEIELAKDPKAKEESMVVSILVFAPCELILSRGIKIGSPKQAVWEVYRDEIDEENSDENNIIIGSVYGGIMITLKKGAVATIFIGAAAE